MNTYAKSHWIPVDVALPQKPIPVVVSVEDYPDPTIAVFYKEEGKWSFADPIVSDEEVNVLAWRLLPPEFETEDFSNLIFANAEETRKRTFCALVRQKRGMDNPEFFAIRIALLKATEEGEWECYFPSLSEDNRNALRDKDYKVEKVNGKWRVSWE